jgi:hypothetical protein
MIDTREITANVAKLIRIISGVGPNNHTRPPISTATTIPCPCWWPACDGAAAHPSGTSIAADTTMDSDTSLAMYAGHQPSRRGDRCASSGRSIRRSFRLVATSSNLPQGCPPARQRHDGHRGIGPILHLDSTNPRRTSHTTSEAGGRRRAPVALAPRRLDVLLRAILARRTLVMEPVLGGPTTTRTPSRPNATLIFFHTMARLPHYIESPPGGFQWPLAWASDRYRLAPCWS